MFYANGLSFCNHFISLSYILMNEIFIELFWLHRNHLSFWANFIMPKSKNSMLNKLRSKLRSLKYYSHNLINYHDLFVRWKELLGNIEQSIYYIRSPRWHSQLKETLKQFPHNLLCSLQIYFTSPIMSFWNLKVELLF